MEALKLTFNLFYCSLYNEQLLQKPVDSTGTSSTQEKGSVSRGIAQSKGRRETLKLYDPKSRKNMTAAEQRSCSAACSTTATVSRICASNTLTGRSTDLSSTGVASEAVTSGNTKRHEVDTPSSSRRWGAGGSNLANENENRLRSGRKEGSGVKGDVTQIRFVELSLYENALGLFNLLKPLFSRH